MDASKQTMSKWRYAKPSRSEMLAEASSKLTANNVSIYLNLRNGSAGVWAGGPFGV